jgi:predicted regulator of Ras-like GTPase activity (Roadblock/LC7/MglB family)
LELRTRAQTEFAAILEPLVAEIPGAWGAVLSDGRGDAIDYVHDSERIGELDIDLMGAQIVQAVQSLHTTTSARRLGQGSFLVETERGALLTAVVAEEYVLTLVLGPDANLGLGLRRFEAGASRIAAALRA